MALHLQPRPINLPRSAAPPPPAARRGHRSDLSQRRRLPTSRYANLPSRLPRRSAGVFRVFASSPRIFLAIGQVQIFDSPIAPVRPVSCEFVWLEEQLRPQLWETQLNWTEPSNLHAAGPVDSPSPGTSLGWKRKLNLPVRSMRHDLMMMVHPEVNFA